MNARNGHPDLVVVNHLANTVSVLLGDGSGAFATHQTYNVGSGPVGDAERAAQERKPKAE